MNRGFQKIKHLIPGRKSLSKRDISGIYLRNQTAVRTVRLHLKALGQLISTVPAFAEKGREFVVFVLCMLHVQVEDKYLHQQQSCTWADDTPWNHWRQTYQLTVTGFLISCELPSPIRRMFPLTTKLEYFAPNLQPLYCFWVPKPLLRGTPGAATAAACALRVRGAIRRPNLSTWAFLGSWSAKFLADSENAIPAWLIGSLPEFRFGL